MHRNEAELHAWLKRIRFILIKKILGLVEFAAAAGVVLRARRNGWAAPVPGHARCPTSVLVPYAQCCGSNDPNGDEPR